MENHDINLVTTGSQFEGTISFEGYTRFNGKLKGTLRGLPGSELILGENSIVEGVIEAETVLIDGFVRGNVIATKKVVIGQTGRLLGEIKSPSIGVKFGGYFDGSCAMNTIVPEPA